MKQASTLSPVSCASGGTLQKALEVNGGESPFMTAMDVQRLLHFPSLDMTRRWLKKLPSDVRARNVGRKVLVIRHRLMAHLGVDVGEESGR